MAALLTRGADIRRRGPSGQTALHCAAFGGGALVARTLVAAGADPGAANDDGSTPVDVARCGNTIVPCSASFYKGNVSLEQTYFAFNTRAGRYGLPKVTKDP